MVQPPSPFPPFQPRPKVLTILFPLTVSTYLSRPPASTNPSNKAILLLSDVFGIYKNIQLIADQFAARGYFAVIPDLFDGDAIAPSDFDSGNVDLKSWLSKHPTEKVDAIVEGMIGHLKSKLGVEYLGGVGYCFGAKVSGLAGVDYF